MDGRSCAEFFLQPQDATQRRYEALRAIFAEGESAVEVADRMSIPQGTVRNWVCEFRKQVDAKTVAPFLSGLLEAVLRERLPQQIP